MVIFHDLQLPKICQWRYEYLHNGFQPTDNKLVFLMLIETFQDQFLDLCRLKMTVQILLGDVA